MSLALIEESAKEVRRLAIAGSPLAVGDFRLKKLVPPLEQAGAKAPVFAQVAKAIHDLINGPESDSAARLLSLSTLLNAILYTQGQNSADGDFTELENFPTNCSSTRTTARVLKPLVEALTSSGAGRLQIIKSAIERGQFNDLRLIDPAIQALGDSFPEVADLVANKILPGYGPGILPRLRTTFDPKGKKCDARKLAVMHDLDPAGTLALCKTALDDGSADVKISAIACLGKHEECLPLVLEQAKAKNKQIRAAALEALAEHDRPEITGLFTELIKSRAFELLAGPFRALRNRRVLASMLDEGNRVFESLVKGDSDQILKFGEILDCLSSQKDAEVEAFLLACFANSGALLKVKSSKTGVIGGPDLVVRLAGILFDIGSPKALEAILEKRESLPNGAFSHVWHSALQIWAPEKVYSEFSPLLDHKKGSGKEKSQDLQRFIHMAHAQLADNVTDLDEPRAAKAATWDPRWLDAAVKADAQLVVYCMARPGHQETMDYLLKLGQGKQPYDASMAVRALVRCRYPRVTDFFLDQIVRKTKGAKYLHYELQSLFNSARYLPKSDLPQLDAFAAGLDEKFVDQFLEAIAPLRPVATASE